MTELQKIHLVGRLWLEGKSNEYIKWECSLLRDHPDHISDLTAMIIASHDYIKLQYI